MSKAKKGYTPATRNDVIEKFLPQETLSTCDPFDGVAAEQWATTMSLFENMIAGSTVDMAVDELVALGNLTRADVLHAVRRTLREILDELPRS